MPYHSASRIAWESVSLLAQHRGKLVTVRAVGVGKATVVAREGSHISRASYPARIEQVCPTPAEP